MTTARTTHAVQAGLSPKAFSNANMTLAFKDTPTKPTRSLTTTKKPSSSPDLLDPSEQTSQADEDKSGANDDDPEDDSLAGHVFAPPAHLQNIDQAASLANNGLETTSGSDELAGLNGTEAVSTDGNYHEYETLSALMGPQTPESVNSDMEMSDAEFDIADDDDDYGAVDQVAELSDDDVNIEASEAAHLASNVNDWSVQSIGAKDTKDENTVDWNDHRTYDFEFPYPYSEQFSDSIETMLPFEAGMGASHSHTISTQASASLCAPAMDCDPHIGSGLFLSARVDRSSLSSNASLNSDADEVTQTSPTEASALYEDSTESEDLNEEIQRRSRIAQSRKKRKIRTIKQQPSRSARSSPVRTSVVRKLYKSSHRVQVLPRLTASGRAMRLSIPKSTHLRWIMGRTQGDPAQHINSPEVTQSLRSRMFQQAYCPDPQALSAIRSLFIPTSFENTQDAQGQLDLLETSTASAVAGRGSQMPAFLQHNNSFDFSNFIDDDGTPGLTLYEDPLNDLLDIEDDSEDVNNEGLRVQRVRELADDVAGSLAFGHDHNATATEECEKEVDSPCPKRRRTIEPSNEAHGLGSPPSILA